MLIPEELRLALVKYCEENDLGIILVGREGMIDNITIAQKIAPPENMMTYIAHLILAGVIDGDFNSNTPGDNVSYRKVTEKGTLKLEDIPFDPDDKKTKKH